MVFFLEMHLCDEQNLIPFFKKLILMTKGGELQTHVGLHLGQRESGGEGRKVNVSVFPPVSVG